jgi:hypothetical protein
LTPWQRQVLAKSVHVDALAKAERALSDAGIQLLNVSDYGQTRGSLHGGEEERSSQVDVQLYVFVLVYQ